MQLRLPVLFEYDVIIARVPCCLSKSTKQEISGTLSAFAHPSLQEVSLDLHVSTFKSMVIKFNQGGGVVWMGLGSLGEGEMGRTLVEWGVDKLENPLIPKPVVLDSLIVLHRCVCPAIEGYMHCASSCAR